LILEPTNVLLLDILLTIIYFLRRKDSKIVGKTIIFLED
jgi:hypothetical protein